MSDDKSTAENMLDAAKAKINEGADRLRAAGHDAASQSSDSTVGGVSDKAKSVKDNAKAEVHHAEADHSMDKARNG